MLSFTDISSTPSIRSQTIVPGTDGYEYRTTSDGRLNHFNTIQIQKENVKRIKNINIVFSFLCPYQFIMINLLIIFFDK